ncbi:MAG TPA: thiol:disulfide interchange protein DsbA/DsbL [Burkholderiales bacterium]
MAAARPALERMKLQSRFRECLLAFVLAILTGAAAAQFQPGREFQRIEPQRPVAADGRVEVIEFFYYGCPVCYETEPFLSRWLGTAPEYVALRRVPALSTEAWEPFAKLFYTLETLGQVARLHWPVYDNFHFDDVKLNDERVMVDWAARNGIDRQKFSETYGSTEVAAKVTQARELLKVYDVRGVPTFIVDGKFLTSARLAGGTQEVIQVVDHLVRLAREERLP